MLLHRANSSDQILPADAHAADAHAADAHATDAHATDARSGLHG